MAADSISRRRDRVAVGANRRTVRRLVEAPVPPRHRQEVTGLMLYAFDAVLRQLVEIKAPRAMELRGYAGRSTRSAGGWQSCIRALRAPQSTRYQPGRVTQVDWAEMPTRPLVYGVSGASTR